MLAVELTRLTPHLNSDAKTNTEGAVGNVPNTNPNVRISLSSPRASIISCEISGSNILYINHSDTHTHTYHTGGYFQGF